MIMDDKLIFAILWGANSTSKARKQFWAHIGMLFPV